MALSDTTPATGSERILDFGRGFGRHAAFLTQETDGSLLGVDADSVIFRVAFEWRRSPGVRFELAKGP